MAAIDVERLLENVRRIRNTLTSGGPGRGPPEHREVKLVIVTKTRPDDAVEALLDAGFRDFGENRIAPFTERHATFPGANWHFIGRLHGKFMPKVVGKAALVHSVASPSTLERMERSAAARDVVQPALIQVNVSGEELKQGFSPAHLREFAASPGFDHVPHVRLDGLMTMAPFTRDVEALRLCFSGLRELRDELNGSFGLQLHHLSMGMTNDYAVAVEEGATMVRIGSAIFEGVETCGTGDVTIPEGP